MHTVLEQIERIGIVPVIKIDEVDKAVPLASALMRGDIPCAEVTFRTAEGEEAIRRIARELPEILLGAGTVLSTEQVDRAIDAGAKFIVSPGFNPAVVRHCIDKGVSVTPGCSCPSDIEKALEMGLRVIKFFPAEQTGGLAYIKAVAAPYPMMRFIPTGGVNAKNMNDYLSYEKIIACGGSWMVKPELVNAGDFDGITALCKQAVQAMLGFELRHIGINASNDQAATETARMFEMLFGFAVKEGNSSIFVGTGVEIMRKPYRGKNGHIAIGTNSVERAKAYLERRGFSFLEETAKRGDKGRLNAIYLKEEIAGFAMHLVQK